MDMDMNQANTWLGNQIESEKTCEYLSVMYTQ
jgi:hypothetical protein